MYNIFFQDLLFQDDHFDSSSWEVSVREREKEKRRRGEEGKLALILDQSSTQLSFSLDIQLTRHSKVSIKVKQLAVCCETRLSYIKSS